MGHFHQSGGDVLPRGERVPEGVECRNEGGGGPIKL